MTEKYIGVNAFIGVLKEMQKEFNECHRAFGKTATCVLKEIINRLQLFPTADVAPVVHAHWERKAYFPDGTPAWVCSRCGHPEEVKYSHCNCGARMEEEKCLWREGTLRVGKSIFHY